MSSALLHLWGYNVRILAEQIFDLRQLSREVVFRLPKKKEK